MSCGSVTVDGAELAYVREGRGPPLFIVGSATYYPKAFSRRLRDDFDLIFADSRHFVPSYVPDPEPAAPLTLDRIAEDVDVVREQLGVDRWPRSGTRSTRRSRWPSRVATQTGSLIWSSLAGCHIPLPSLRTRPHALWRDMLGQHLNGDGAVQAGVGGLVDLAYAAGAEGGVDLAGAEGGAGLERHGYGHAL